MTAMSPSHNSLQTPAEQAEPNTDVASPGESLESPLTNTPTPSLGTHAIRGAYWSILSAVVIKCMSLASQLLLARLLMPSDFGLVAMALSVMGFFEIFASGGPLVNAMVQRRADMTREGSQVFWLSLTLHLLAAALIMLVAPLAGWWFNEPRVTPLMMVAAGAIPIAGLTTIHQVKLMLDLRFAIIPAAHMLEGLSISIGSVGLAALGFGAYSLVLPKFVGYILSFGLLRYSTGRLPIEQPQPRLWTAILMPSLWLSAQGISAAVQNNGTCFMLGSISKDASIVGLYAWGFMLSGQTMHLLVNSLRNVLLPTFSKLNDEPTRQRDGYLTTLRAIMFVTAPLCVLQAVLAEPLIRGFFPKWVGAIAVVQSISLGMLSQPLTLLNNSLLVARGHLRALTLLTFMQGSFVVLAASAGALLGDLNAVAILAAVAMFFNGLAAAYVSQRVLGAGFAGAGRTFLAVSLALVSGLGGLWAVHAVTLSGRFAQLGTGLLAYAASYSVLTAIFNRNDLYLISARVLKQRGPRKTPECL